MAKAKKTAPKKKATKPKGDRTRHLIPFKKGERRVGRVKGTPNKLGVRIKEAITEALECSGSNGKGKDGAVGYFVWLSRAEPAVFGGLVGKVLPMQLEVKDKTDKLTPTEAVERLKERGLPVPPTLMSLANQIGQAVMERQEEDYEDELNGLNEGNEDEPIDDDGDGDQQDAA